MRQHQAVFANFICKFGDANMADYLREVVLPAFTDDTLVRRARGSYYHLLDVRLFDSLIEGANEPAVAGQFVQDTVLVRDQVFDQETGKLIPDEAYLDTSPSAFFVLLLKDHRLLYFAETRHAPSLSSFQSTMQRFLTDKHREFIDAVYDFEKEQGRKTTKRALKEVIPVPVLKVVPITNSALLAEYIALFDRLQRVDLIIHRKNDEPTAASLIKNAEAYTALLKGEQTRITTTDKDGLDKDGAVKALAGATDGANETIRLTGTDRHGDRLSGENDDFSVTTMIEHLAGSVKEKASSLYAKFQELVGRGEIKRPEVAPERVEQIAEAARSDA